MPNLTIVSNDVYAIQLAQAHYALEPNIQLIVRLMPLTSEDPLTNPVALLEVVSGMPTVAVRPLMFPAKVEGAAWYPPVILFQVSPDQYQHLRIHTNELERFGYRMGFSIQKPKKKK